MTHYKLEGTQVVECDLMEWARFMETPSKRRVALTRIGLFQVSTVFLGLDHNWGGGGPPLVFETMVFSRITGGADLHMERCSTYAQAIMMHERALRDCRTWEMYKSLLCEIPHQIYHWWWLTQPKISKAWRDFRDGFVQALNGIMWWR